MNEQEQEYPKYLIDWLGGVYDTCDLYYVGTLVCGPDERGYTVRVDGTLEHVPAELVKIQILRAGSYV